MDELINALTELNSYLDKYCTDLSDEMDGLLKVVGDTKSNLGRDTIGLKTVDMILPLIKKLRESYNEINNLSKRIEVKLDELCAIKSMYQQDEDNEGNSQLPYGQKTIPKELLYRR